MRGNPGTLVLTKNGMIGIILNKEKMIDGKYLVHILNGDFTFKLDENKQPIKLLCKPESLKAIGKYD